MALSRSSIAIKTMLWTTAIHPYCGDCKRTGSYTMVMSGTGAVDTLEVNMGLPGH